MGDTTNDVALDCARRSARGEPSSWPDVSHPLITRAWHAMGDASCERAGLQPDGNLLCPASEGLYQ